MHPIYLPLVLALAAPAQPGAPTSPAATVTGAASESPTAAPSRTATAPSATPSSPATQTSTATPSASPSATAGAATTEPPGSLEFRPIGSRVSREVARDTARWTMWVEYQNPSRAQDVVGVALVGALRGPRGEPLGERIPTIGPAPILALAGEHGCFKASWEAPKAAVGADWSMKAVLARARMASAVPAEILSVDQPVGSAYMDVRAALAITRTSTVAMTAILRDRGQVVVTCGAQWGRVDPGGPQLFRLAIGERVFATAPIREIRFRATIAR